MAEDNMPKVLWQKKNTFNHPLLCQASDCEGSGIQRGNTAVQGQVQHRGTGEAESMTPCHRMTVTKCPGSVAATGACRH